MSGGGGGGNTNTIQKADPWGPMQPRLLKAAQQNYRAYRDGDLQVDPVRGDETFLAENMMLDRAMAGAPGTEMAAGTLSRMMDPDAIAAGLDGVKGRALDTAIPAAVSQFAGAGMPNSTLAMDTVGQAAVDAIAPYEYGAHESAQNRAITAAGMAPSIDAAGYLPAQMVGSVGAARDNFAMAQEAAPVEAFQTYLANTMGLGGMGSTSTMSAPSNDPSFLQRAGAGGLTGIGTFGALSAAGVANPLAIPLSVGAGLLGML